MRGEPLVLVFHGQAGGRGDFGAELPCPLGGHAFRSIQTDWKTNDHGDDTFFIAHRGDGIEHGFAPCVDVPHR